MAANLHAAGAMLFTARKLSQSQCGATMLAEPNGVSRSGAIVQTGARQQEAE